MTDWLLDTLLWTAVLIGVVLLVRRPVAHWFGPQVAYALWALPIVRLILPPIQLPSWLAPEPAASDPSITFLAPESAASTATPEVVASSLLGSGSAASDAAISPPVQGLFETGPWLEMALAIWLIGAAVFLWLRFSAYFSLRDDLLDDAREVGRSGKIRLMETPGTKAPLAFGVIDPVIALPEGFMANPDRSARDLALAHEMAHHKGRDLLINIVAQPLFALHWWNPLGRYGWLALRRDQEAACDARVVAAKPAEERAVYAEVIAGFAAGPNVALAAPMACPVLGDKSIIQRLRSLNMSDLSNRRRMAGRMMLGAAVLALPLTASISYAESNAPDAPAAPTAPDVSVAPPLPPAPPPAPAAVVAPEIVTIDPDGETEVRETEDGRTVIIKREITDDGDGKKREKRVEKIKIVNREKLSDEELEAMLSGLRSGLAEADKALKDMPKIVRRAMIDMEVDGDTGRTVVKMECDGEPGEATWSQKGKEKVRTIYLCQADVMAEALEGLKEARNEIANDSEMGNEMRAKVLKVLDEQIKNWKSKG